MTLLPPPDVEGELLAQLAHTTFDTVHPDELLELCLHLLLGGIELLVCEQLGLVLVGGLFCRLACLSVCLLAVLAAWVEALLQKLGPRCVLHALCHAYTTHTRLRSATTGGRVQLLGKRGGAVPCLGLS